jgi:CheY-like chemotaxis protein
VEEFDQVDILLVEDNPLDAELTMRGLKDQKLANSITWVKDGEEALDYVFRVCASNG